MPADSGAPELIALDGETMGTTYRILLAAASTSGDNRRQTLADAVAARLYHLDRELLSTYSADSELSRFNALAPGQAMTISRELVHVIDTAMSVHRQSAGAFDITIKPLVDLWGFGPTPRSGTLPDETAISRALGQLGMDKIRLDRDAATLAKVDPVTLDLSAIAKGFAVDEIAALLEAQGIGDYLVEIGGEVVSRGQKPGGEPWRLGIETPTGGEATLYQPLAANAGRLALAGSGNYRNFFMVDGQRYSHTLDPASGRPVTHELASVTVVARSAMLADAWATALLVMGEEAGMQRANALQLAAYFIADGTSQRRASHSRAFTRYLPDNP